MVSDDEKKRLIEELTKTPIVGVACKNVGISRASFYRWKDEDPWFVEQVALALRIGRGPVNDRAESVAIKQINQSNFAAAKWWLTIHHEDYKKLTREEKEQKRPGLVNYLKDLIARREKLEKDSKEPSQ
jgi:hypothetical protein